MSKATLTSRPFRESALRNRGFHPYNEIAVYFGLWARKLPGLNQGVLHRWAEAGLIEMTPFNSQPGEGSFMLSWWYRIEGLGKVSAAALYEELKAAYEAVERLGRGDPERSDGDFM